MKTFLPWREKTAWLFHNLYFLVSYRWYFITKITAWYFHFVVSPKEIETQRETVIAWYTSLGVNNTLKIDPKLATSHFLLNSWFFFKAYILVTFQNLTMLRLVLLCRIFKMANYFGWHHFLRQEVTTNPLVLLLPYKWYFLGIKVHGRYSLSECTDCLRLKMYHSKHSVRALKSDKAFLRENHLSFHFCWMACTQH